MFDQVSGALACTTRRTRGRIRDTCWKKAIGFSWLPSTQRATRQADKIQFVPMPILPASNNSPLNYWRVYCLSHKSRLCESIGSKVADMPGYASRWHGPADNAAKCDSAINLLNIHQKYFIWVSMQYCFLF